MSRLTKGVSGTDQELFSKDELNKFADFYRDKWDENTSEDVIAESFVDYWWDTDWKRRAGLTPSGTRD